MGDETQETIEEVHRIKELLSEAYDVERDPVAVEAGRRVANLPD
jgi:hypothetical protein